MAHLKKERTLVVIKPDGVQRSLIGEIIQRYERLGLKLVAMKMTVPTEEHVEAHYTVDPEWFRKTGTKTIEGYKAKGLTPPTEDPVALARGVLNNLKKYLTKSPVVAMVWEGAHAVELVRKLTGGTEPLKSDVGTIRGDYVLDSYQMSDTDGRAVRNLVHASGTPDEAAKEISLWFLPDEIVNYRLVGERILYDVNLDGLLE
ncbi:MAG: nucleoside-diphosphate kinase [Parcubacteria group bacterium]|nr:nucleoside-diphosphate kinase [Parcubacteria group bacterium]